MTATVTTVPVPGDMFDERYRGRAVTFVSDTLLIFRRQLRLSLRNPAWVIIGLIQPILYLAFFGPLLAKIASAGALGVPAGNPYSFFVPGLLIQLGLFGAAFVGFTIIAGATPFGYIINAMRDVFAGSYFNAVVAEGIGVSVGLAIVCLWLAGRAFAKENA